MHAERCGRSGESCALGWPPRCTCPEHCDARFGLAKFPDLPADHVSDTAEARLGAVECRLAMDAAPALRAHSLRNDHQRKVTSLAADRLDVVGDTMVM